MTQLFFFGATGHIGGATLNAILTRFPHIELVALVRDQQKATKLTSSSKKIRTVIGDFQDLELIGKESRAADIVINTSPDLLPGSHAAIEAALKGLSARSEKGFYIQTSGAFIIGEDTGGKAGSGKIWSDIADIDALVAMPSTRYHQRTEQIVRDASANVNVAIVSPTVVYGLSSSLENQIPITIRDIVDTVSELSAGFTIAQGENILGYIHADDLADIYVRLVADALKGLEGHDPRLWGAHAYYFAVGEDMSFAAYMKALVEVLQTRVSLSTNAIKEIGEANDVAEQEVVARTAASHGCGVNVRCRSDRAETLLGWKAKGLGLIDTLPGVVDILLSRSAH